MFAYHPAVVTPNRYQTDLKAISDYSRTCSTSVGFLSEG